MKPKVQNPKDKKSGFIYSYQCGDIAYDEEYIGETSRTLAVPSMCTTSLLDIHQHQITST